MELDPYQPCPGGLDKKIKFCCKDLVRELDDVSRKLEANQMEAARLMLDQLQEKHGDRDCLCAIGCSLSLRLDDLETAEEKIDQFRSQSPQNPIALALSAISAAGKQPDMDESGEFDREQLHQQSREAMDLLQAALSVCGSQVPLQVYEAVGVLAQRMLAEGQTLAARELFTLQAVMSEEAAEEPVSRIMEIGSSSASALLKQEILLPEPPAGGAGRDQYVAALKDAARGAWDKAAEQIIPLIEQNPSEPIYIQAVASLSLRLARTPEAVALLRCYADLDGVDATAAIEAEAVAQLIDPDTYASQSDIVEATWATDDPDVLLAALQSDRRAVSMRTDFSSMATEDAPPPKAGFWLLNKPLPESVDGLEASELPDSLCELLLYGKQTDQEARLQLIIARGNDYDDARAILKEIGGGQLSGDPSEEVLGQVATAGAQLRVQTHFPDETPVGVRGRMLSLRYEDTLLTKWVNIPLDVLGGKTPTEASADSTLHRKLAAAILVLESGPQQHDNLSLYDELRSNLGLPAAQRGSAFEDVRRTPLMQLSRLDPTLLSDEDLMMAYSLAAQNSVWISVIKLGTELTKRDSIAKRVNLAEIFARLAKYALDRDEALRLIKKAQQFEVDRGESPARWKVSELGMRLATGDSPGAQQLLNAIQTQHMNEPGIPQLLVQMLSQFGLIRPDGRPVAAPPTGDAPALAGGPGEPMGGAPAAPVMAAESKPESGGKSKLWLPGMD